MGTESLQRYLFKTWTKIQNVNVMSNKITVVLKTFGALYEEPLDALSTESLKS